MAVTVERKLEVARRSFQILVEQMGIAPEDIFLDPLVFPCGTGDAQLPRLGGADDRRRPRDQGAVPGLQDDPRHLQRLLRPADRRPRGAQLRLPLPLHPGRARRGHRQLREAGALRRHPAGGARARRGADLPAHRRRRGRQPGGRGLRRLLPRTYRERRRRRRRAPSCRSTSASPRYIVEGSKDGLDADLEAALADPRWPSPLDIINGPLMAGMDEVGRLFNDNQLIVAEVLQSAEVMKAAVSYLEPHMEKADSRRPRQGPARHGQGRRPRHRQEPGRHHPRQQRLQGRQPGHQGAAPSS